MFSKISMNASLKRALKLVALSQVCLLQLNGCFDQNTIFAALADSLAFTVGVAAQGFLSTLLNV